MNFRDARAKSRKVFLHHPFEVGAAREKGLRHRLGLVQIEINPQAVLARATNHDSKICQSFFVTGADVWVPGKGRKLVEVGLKPNTLHSASGQSLHVTLRKGSVPLFNQGIVKACEKRITTIGRE